MIDHKELQWKSKTGKDLHAIHWPLQNPKGVICIVHGMGEHIGRYHHVADYFAKHGYASIGFDHPGHGKTKGPRGHVNSLEELLDNVDLTLTWAKQHYPNTKQIVYGHSMGGNVAINHAIRKPIRAAAYIITGPWLKLAFPVPSIQMTMGKLMRKVYPKYTDRSKLDATGLSHVASAVEAYQADPLVHDSISTAFFFAIHEGGEWALQNASQLKIPMLVMHGGDDPVTSAAASKQFAEANTQFVSHKEWHGLLHEIHHEAEQLQVLDYSLNWLKQQN